MGFRQGLWVLRGVPWVGFRSPLCCFLLYCWDFLCLVTAGEGPCDLAHPTSWSLKCDRHHLEAKTGVPHSRGKTGLHGGVEPQRAAHPCPLWAWGPQVPVSTTGPKTVRRGAGLFKVDKPPGCVLSAHGLRDKEPQG